MINAKAIRIESGRVGIAGIELSYTVSQVRLLEIERISVEIRLHRWCCIRAGALIGNRGHSRIGQSQSQPLVRKKEEAASFCNWAAERPAEVILAFSCLRQSRPICISIEPVVRIENVIPEIVED